MLPHMNPNCAYKSPLLAGFPAALGATACCFGPLLLVTIGLGDSDLQYQLFRQSNCIASRRRYLPRHNASQRLVPIFLKHRCTSNIRPRPLLRRPFSQEENHCITAQAASNRTAILLAAKCVASPLQGIGEKDAGAKICKSDILRYHHIGPL